MSALSFIVALITTIITRVVFLDVLGIQILGIDAFYMSILAIVSFLELGIGSSVVFALYKPVMQNNEEEILQIKIFLRQVYRLIILLSSFATLILPFSFQYIIDIPLTFELVVCFYLLSFASVAKYLFAEYKALGFAYQLSVLESQQNLTLSLLKGGAQVLVLLSTESYLMYGLVVLTLNIAFAFYYRHKLTRIHPFMSASPKVPIAQDIISAVKKNVFGGIVHRFASMVVTGTDSLLIMFFLGSATLGIYSNYNLVLTNLIGLVMFSFNPLSAYVGRVARRDGAADLSELYFQLYSLVAIVAPFGSICLYFLINDFVRITFGEQYTVDSIVIAYIAVLFYVVTLRRHNIVFVNALGLNWDLKLKSVLEAVLNAVISVSLISLTDLTVEAVLIGTISSNILTNMWWEPYVVFRNAVRISLTSYLTRLVFNFFVLLALVYSLDAYILHAWVPVTVANFALKAVSVIALSVILAFVVNLHQKKLLSFRWIID